MGSPAILRRRLTDRDIGQMIDDKGILIAPAFRHLSRYGYSIGPKFDYFAAPQDLHVLDGLDALDTRENSVRRVAALRNVLGHDGTSSEKNTKFTNEYGAVYLPKQLSDEDDIINNPDAEHLHAALAFWHFPTLPLSSGHGDSGNKTHGYENNIYRHRNTGRLAGTFNKNAAYWTLSHHRDLVYTYDETTKRYNDRKNFWLTDFRSGRSEFRNTGAERASVRPVRAELRID
jgi:hypothetical protein